MQTLIRKFKSDDFTTRLKQIETDLKGVKQEYKLLDIEQESSIKKEDDLQNQIVRLNEKIVKLNDSGVSIEELEKRLKILQKKKEDTTSQKDSIQDRISHREELQLELEEILDKFDEEDLEKVLVF